MSYIGPQLPPHLLQNSIKNEDEGEDEAGPQPRREASSIGPQVPAHLLSKELQQPVSDTVNEDGDEDDYVPELPPDLAASRTGPSSRPMASPSSPPRGRRIVGPSLPVHDRSNYDEDDDDDDYGPMPSMQGAQKLDAVNEGVREFLEKEEKRKKEIEVSLLRYQTMLILFNYGYV